MRSDHPAINEVRLCGQFLCNSCLKSTGPLLQAIHTSRREISVVALMSLISQPFVTFFYFLPWFCLDRDYGINKD